MSKKCISVVLLALLLTSCNLPLQSATKPSVSEPLVQSGAVQILSPQNGIQLPGTAVLVQFIATGGPYLEVDLLVDNVPVATLAQDMTSGSISGAISWEQPTGGPHTLTIQVLTLNKEISSASVQVAIVGAGVVQAPAAQPTQDASLERARQRIIQIILDNYGITLTNPPVGRKARQGVTTDPWTSALYYKDWFISVSIYPDGREVDYAYPLNYSDPYATPSLMKPGDKPIPMCRPSGTIKLLVVFVDYQNLGITKQEAFDSLAQAVHQINGRYVEASQAVGLRTPILQIQFTPAYLSQPPAMPDHLLDPELVRTSTGFDPAQFDMLIQIDLDGNDTSGMVARLGSYGFATSGCGPLSSNVNMWIAISKKDQLLQTSADPRLQYTLGHEILHTMGYPIGLTGVHEWVCGDGTVPDLTDQCDQNNLPTLMMGWTDTDGDGVVEILDKTPYGLLTP